MFTSLKRLKTGLYVVFVHSELIPNLFVLCKHKFVSNNFVTFRDLLFKLFSPSL